MIISNILLSLKKNSKNFKKTKKNMKREFNSRKWTFIAIGYQTGIAWTFSMLIFQVGTLPGVSTTGFRCLPRSNQRIVIVRSFP